MSHSTLPLTPRIAGAARSSRRSWPTLDQVWLLMVPLLVATKVLLTPIAPYDFWWHIAYGRAIIADGRIPTTDVWSWSLHGTPYFDQPWLSQIIMYGVYQLTGAAGTQVFQAVLVAGTYWLLRSTIEATGTTRRLAALLTLLAAIGAHDNWHVRPQTFVLPLFVAAIALLERWRRHGRTPWLLVPMLALWANLHGTWTLPLVLGGAYVAGETLHARHALLPRIFPHPANGDTSTRSWREIIALGACLVLALLATLLNPRGAGVWTYTLSLLGNRAVTTLVSEWATPAWGSASGFIVVALLLLAGGVVVVRRERVTPAQILALLPFALLSIQAVRNIIWLAALAPVMLAPLLQGEPAARPRRRIEAFGLNRMILALLVLLVVLSLPWLKTGLALPKEITAVVDAETPVAAVPRLLAQLERPLRLYHDMGYGSYLMWAAPGQPVFLDPRIEHYPYEQWQDYIRLGQGKQISTLVTRYGIDGFLLHKEHQAGLIKALRADPRWREVFSVEDTLLFLPAARR